MAKPFNERATTALTDPNYRSKDFPGLITEGGDLQDAQLAIVQRATADSINFSLTEAERDAAAAEADRARREAAALSSAVTALTAKLEERRSSEDAQATAAKRAEIIAERDDLAELYRTRWPALEREVVELLTAQEANNARMRAAQIYEPTAEMVARGCGPSLGTAGAPRSLTETRLPSFTEVREFAWPKPKAAKPVVDLGAEYRRQILASRASRDAENARWAKYFVTPPADRREPVNIEAREGTGKLRRQAVLTLTAELVEKAREAGCTVEPANGCTLGTPAAVATF